MWGESRTQALSFGTPETESSFARHRHRCMILKRIFLGNTVYNVDWISAKWRSVVNTEINFRSNKNALVHGLSFCYSLE